METLLRRFPPKQGHTNIDNENFPGFDFGATDQIKVQVSELEEKLKKAFGSTVISAKKARSLRRRGREARRTKEIRGHGAGIRGQ